MICEIMYNKNHAQFESIVMEKDMQGKTRAYFSNNKEVYTAMYDEEKFPIVIYTLKQHIVQIQYVTL